MVATLNKNEVPIKSYSFDGNFDNLPEEYKDFLSARLYEYSEMIEEAEKTQVVDSDYKKVWDYLENYTENSPKPIIETNTVNMNNSANVEMPPALPEKKSRTYTPNHTNEVLLNTAWGQGATETLAAATYNLYTPILTNTDGRDGHTKVGCAPLAWGQIIRYHEWPLIPKGTTDSYDWAKGGITLSGKALWYKNRYDLTRIDNTYDWELMDYNITASDSEDKIKAIGTLLADIGYALHADWGLDSTGAWTHGPNDALPEIEDHFGYSTNMRREVYLQGNQTYPANEVVNYDTFVNSIITDINNTQPLLFAYTGHATVIDGYRNVSYNSGSVVSFETHINFGWETTDLDYYVFSQTPTINNPTYPVGTLTEAAIVAGIKPYTNSANDCAFNFYLEGKRGLTLKSGWNLVSLISDNDDINFMDFTNADTISTSTPVWKFNNGSWISNPMDIKPKDVLWIKHVGTTEYVFPGSQTTNVILNATDVSNAPSGSSLLGTGGEIPLSLLTSHGVTNCQIYNVTNQVWNACPSTILAGSGIAIQKQ